MVKLTIKPVWFAVIVSIILLTSIALVSIFLNVPIHAMTKDVAAIGGIHPFSGFLSSLGIILWFAGGSICFFIATVLKNKSLMESVSFLYATAFLSFYLSFDDLFQFHETIASAYFGIDELFVYIALALSLLAYLFVFKSLILKANYIFLVFAFGFLGSSVLVDSLPYELLSSIGHWEFLIEDGFKWIGIVSWVLYCLDISYNALVLKLGS